MTAPANEVARIMGAFCERTGLSSDRGPRRYLWTDAFAVCNCLGLYRETQQDEWRTRALTLIEQVHHVLGRHRPDDERSGWISELSEAEGERHPTAGGLRIGKPLPERSLEGAPDEQLDWDRDGQYYHYLTRWLHALLRAAEVTRNRELIRYAAELAAAAHRGFRHPAAGGPRLFWKMSIDLSRPAVRAMGHHDALDGLVTTAAVQAAAAAEPPATVPGLDAELEELAQMCAGGHWATNDALGIGGLLTSALGLARLRQLDTAPVSAEVLRRVLQDAARSLDLVTVGRFPGGRAGERLAFRELGLGIGLAAMEHLDALRQQPGLLDAAETAALDRLLRHLPLRAALESFWLEREHQRTETWLEHQDINEVMLATCLLPDGYLG